MSSHHAEPGEIVNLETWADDLPDEHSKAIVRTDEMELARFTLEPDETLEDDNVKGPIVIHCLSGQVEFTTSTLTQPLGPGELVYITASQPFTLRGVQSSRVLVTFIFA